MTELGIAGLGNLPHLLLALHSELAAQCLSSVQWMEPEPIKHAGRKLSNLYKQGVPGAEKIAPVSHPVTCSGRIKAFVHMELHTSRFPFSQVTLWFSSFA